MKKRILCLFLSLVMVLSLLPTSVLAAEGDPPATTEYTSGGCTVSFTYEDGDGNYTATVKATAGESGKMATYAMYDKVTTAPDTVAPWIKDGWNEFTTKIVIDDSVAALSGHAFETFSATKEIVFPENPKFTSIPSNFMMINGLEELTIPEGITSVGNFAFSQRSITTGAITLKRVVLPSTLQVPEPNTVNGTNGNQAFTYWNSPVATGSIADLNEAQKAIFPMTTVVTSTAAQVAWAESLGYTVEHTYGEPTYEWSEGYGTCTATVTCTRGDDATITENATVTSAGSVHTATFTDSRFATQTVDSSKSMKVLFFGNSYTEDATNNSPMATSKTWEALAALCGEDVDPKNVVVGAMTSGGKSMAWHALQAQEGNASYTLRVCEGTDTWTNVSVKTVDDALKYAKWDFVILQPYTNESHGGNDGSAQGDDQGSQNQNYEAAQVFTSLNASCTELLDHIQKYAPQAKTYLYMLWQHNSGDITDAEGTNTGYETIVSTITAAANYKSSDNTYGFAGYVPVGTAIQNARTTYLAGLRYHVGETVNLANDPVKGMERDSHLTFNIGRYIAGLTFAETLAKAKGYTWNESDIPALRVSEAIGKLPDQYWEIAKASVAAAITTPNATTTISGYETDPAVAAKKAIESIGYSDIAVTTASEVKAAVTEKINALTLPAGVKVGTVTVTSVQPAINTFSATVPVTYGYTTATAMPYAGKQMSYVSGGCMVTFSDDDGDGNYTATVKAIEGGTGVMDNYNVANGGQTPSANQAGKTLPPWMYEWKDHTTKLVIDSSVKGLGGNAFEYMYKIEEVVFPENPQFTYIPSNFMMVNSLKEVTIPEGITSIGPFAFSQRDFKESALTLKKVTLPTTLTSVATTYTNDGNLNQSFTYWNGAGNKTAAEYAASMPYLFSSTTIVPATPAQLTWATEMGYTVEHVYGEIQYVWTNDFSQCTATLPCTTGDGYEVTETARSTKVGATYTVTFENPLLGSTSISAGTKLPTGLKLVGGTAGNTDYNSNPAMVDGSTGTTVVLEYVAATDVDTDVKADVETAAETFLSADEKVLAVVEANLYINNGGTLTRVSNAELNANIEVLIPYSKAVPGQTYVLYHYNGTGFDDSIAAEGVMVGGVRYLKFQYNKFSPFVIVGGVGYNAITATTGEGYTVTYSGMGKTGEDYTFTVTVDSGYTIQSVKANGKVFGTDTGFEDNGSGSYTIKNLNDNYKIEVKVVKNDVKKNLTYADAVGNGAVAAAETVVGSVVTVAPTKPTAAGKTFLGWRSSHEGRVYQPGDTFVMPDTDVTLTAQWQDDPTKYSVTYNKNASVAVTGMPDSISDIASGSGYTISNAEPSRAGYTFKGWATSDTATAANPDYAPGKTITVNADVTLYAVWVQNTVQVTLPNDGTGYTITATAPLAKNATVNVTEGSTQTFTVTLTEGYDPSTLVVTANTVPLAAVRENGTNKYYYTFTADVDTTIKITAPTKYQYTVTLPTGDHFTAKFDSGADSDTVDKVEHGSDSTKFTITPASDWTVDAVYANGVELTATAGKYQVTNVTANTVVTISMKEIVWRTVTYFLDDAGMYAQVQVQDGTTNYTTLAVPTVEGYTVTGWYDNPNYTGSSATTVTSVNGDLSLYAKKEAKTYKINYNANEPSGTASGMPDTHTTKTFGKAATLSSAVPTLSGYTFLGWGTSASAKTPNYQPGDTYSAEITADVTLYAVWKVNTYTVTLPTGTGYSISTTQSTTVNYGGSFTFTVKVDRDYSTAAPVVSWTKADGTGTATTLTVVGNVINNDDGSKSYTYTIVNFTEDRVVSVTVEENKTYTVTFYTWKNDGTTTEVYQTQQVEDTYKATQPAAPVIEGYTFGGWFTVKAGADFVIGSGSTKNTELDAAYNFDTAVKDNLNVVAKMVAIKPVVTIPDNGTGWSIAFDTTDTTGVAGTGTLRTHTHAYNEDCTFTVTIAEGYDASNMQVGANGVALAPIDITGNVYTYKLTGVKVDTTITVVGVVRKTVTITYNANARDDVSDMPEQQVVKYYLDGADNDTIVKQYPVRTGYEFLGWCTDSAYTGSDAVPSGETYYAKAAIEAGADSVFTKDTTLYAIWQAKSVTIELAVSDVAVPADTGTNAKEYEGQPVTLTATLSPAVSTGSVNFYQSSDGTNWTVISSQSANGSTKYTFKATTGAYSGTDTYKVEYKAESAEGYSDDTSDTVSVDRLSTTITWKLDSDAVLNTAPAGEGPAYYYASTLTITPDGGSALTPGTAMTAGQTYTLTAPAVYELGTTTALTVGTDYTITWQYLDGANGWTTRAENQTTSTYKVTSEYSEYQFRALMVVNTGDSTVYTKAAKFESEYYGARQTETMSWLISEPTPAVVLQQTTTTLAITGADNELATTKFNGQTLFSNDHWAQFEGQKVTLKATVKETSTDTPAVTTGYVNFYRYGTTEPLNITPVEVGANGVATFEVTISDYSTASGQTALTNVDRFYAVYLVNDTYDTSASVTKSGTTPPVYNQPGDVDSVWIKSTAIKTPVIDSVGTVAPTGKLNGTDVTYTSYAYDLEELLAGVEHKFTLRETGAEATGLTSDWSVVALDGRTVASTDYTIQWLVTTGTNEEKAANNETAATFVVNESKSGDKYRVELVPTGDMKTGATSRYVEIGTKQDVNVTVTASDEIKSTTGVTDAYQLDEVTLTATVAAVQGANATVKPSGTVAFYYQDGTSWVYLGEAVLNVDTDGQMRASIDTTKLPVAVTTNTKQDVTITAIYSGDETFKTSGTISSGAITDTAGCTVTDATVTVYSSVVLVHAAEENKAVTSLTDGGIHISAEDGKVLANETRVNLKLSDVFTLDYNNATVGTVDLSKLAYGTEADYTVQWQKLSNAASYASDYADEEVPWQPITSANGTICQITVEQGAAYRAMITVNNTPIAKGSYTFVDQVIDGRQVYYSNILVAADAPATVTVNVNTSNTTDGYEGIVEGETVTIHTFASGASGTTPISELTMTVTELDTDGITPVAVVNEQVKTNVNGHVSFDWTAAKPGYYELKVVAKFTNGYSDKEITRTLIVRDNAYDFTAAGDNTTYNGKVQGLTVTVNNMGIESDLAQKSVVVYYYTDANRTQQVEPTQAGTYYATIRLQESAYWTEKTLETTFTIEKRAVEIDDLIAQAKVYDGTTNANIQEIILNDAETAQTTTGLPTGTTGIINGDSVYAIGTAKTNSANVNEANSVTVTVTELLGDDAANYTLVNNTYTEAFNIQRSQVKGDIANSTFKYTGSNITVPADDIYLIDQAGNVITPANYTVTYYYHNGDGVEQVDAMNKLGKYTVIARPEQDNYKGGASQTVYVVSGTGVPGTLTTYTSALINITNTVELYGAAGNTGIKASATNGATTTVGYWNGTAWGGRPTDAGRYLVKATVTNGTVTDTAYGIYTIVKARPEFAPTTDAAVVTYNSAPYSGTVAPGFETGKSDSTAETYITYTGGTIQGIAYEAPTEVGKYIATVHVGETDNYTAHEEQVAFEIKPKALKITADSLQRRQYGAFPDMTASFDGLADSAYAPDTSLRDVQIQPELIFNETDGYDNIAMDHVGNEYPIIAIAALARNYDVSYVNGNLSVTRDEPNPYLAIHGMIDNGNGGDIAYYGDVIQLYAYGSQSKTTGVINNSSVLTWSVTPDSGFSGSVNIDENGLLTINGVGTFTVTLTRGVGAQKISTTLTIDARKQEVKVDVKDQDKVYNGETQTYSGSMTAYDEKFSPVSTTITSGNTTRVDGNIGSQIVTGKVADGVDYYQSETYGGLFTINDKEVTVKPNAATTTYGTKASGLTYTEVTPAGSDRVLTNGKAVSVADQYGNLDVYDGYEILVAGVENMNYNVKYITDQTAPDAEVTAKPLTVSTGTLNNNVGMTSGSLNPQGNYPANGAEVDSTAALGAANVRMYGEPNWVMDYALATLVDGDSLADLALDPLADNLVKFNYNIGADANITYPTRNDPSPTAVAGRSAYNVDTDASMIAFKNYGETYSMGTQNIYQRPVTLAVRPGVTLTAYKPSVVDLSSNTLKTDAKDTILQLLLNNLVVGEYNGKGGLATKLGHTIEKLQIKVVDATYTGSNKITVTIKLDNQNYWTENLNFEVEVSPTKIWVEYGTLYKTSASVTMYMMDEAGVKTGTTDLTGTVRYLIYDYDANDNNQGYSYYKNKSTVRNEVMTARGNNSGIYNVTFDSLPAGRYVMFVIADNYTIIE